MIQKEDLGKGHWEDGDALCKNSRVAGYSGWRLPTIDELSMMYSAKNKIPNLKTDYRYWSSNSVYYNNTGTQYYWLSFIDGSQDSESGHYTGYYRAVRTIK